MNHSSSNHHHHQIHHHHHQNIKKEQEEEEEEEVKKNNQPNIDSHKSPIRPKLSPTNLAVSSPDIKSLLTIHHSSITPSTHSQFNHQLNKSHPITLINQSLSLSPPHSLKPSYPESIPSQPSLPHHSSTLNTPSSSANPIPSSSSSSSTTNPNLFDPLPSLPSRLRKASLKLIPPPNFGFIESSLYRSGEPNELSYKFLISLKLKSLIWLAPRPISSSFRECLNSTVKFYDLGILHAAAIDEVTDEAVTEALRLILSPKLYPLMIMCAGGSHRTGTVIGCLRKLQGWNLASIFEEYRRYAGAQHHIMNEQFIEFYDTRRLTNHLFKEIDHPHAHAQNEIQFENLVIHVENIKADDRQDEERMKRATPAGEMGCKTLSLN